MTSSSLLDSPLIQWFAAHWEPLLFAALLVGTGLWVFRSALGIYTHVFFPARAVRNAFLKAVAMVALLFAIYAIPHWLAEALLPPGRIQVLGIAVSFILFDTIWEGAGRLLDRLLIGR
jgi:hypothetical protein